MGLSRNRFLTVAARYDRRGEHGRRACAATSLEFHAGPAWAGGIARGLFGGLGGWGGGSWLGFDYFHCNQFGEPVVGVAGAVEFLRGAGFIAREFGEYVGTGGVMAERLAHEDIVAIPLNQSGRFRICAFIGGGGGEEGRLKPAAEFATPFGDGVLADYVFVGGRLFREAVMQFNDELVDTVFIGWREALESGEETVADAVFRCRCFSLFRFWAGREFGVLGVGEALGWGGHWGDSFDLRIERGVKDFGVETRLWDDCTCGNCVVKPIE